MRLHAAKDLIGGGFAAEHLVLSGSVGTERITGNQGRLEPALAELAATNESDWPGLEELEPISDSEKSNRNPGRSLEPQGCNPLILPDF